MRRFLFSIAEEMLIGSSLFQVGNAKSNPAVSR